MKVQFLKPTDTGLRTEIFTLRAAAYRQFITDDVTEFTDAFDRHSNTWQSAAIDHGRVVGAVRVSLDHLPCADHCREASLLNGNNVEVSRLCIDPDISNPLVRFQIFRALLRDAILSCRALNATFVIACAARPDLVKLYRNIGLSLAWISHPEPPVTVPVDVMVAPFRDVWAAQNSRAGIASRITPEDIATRFHQLGIKEAA